MDRDDALLELGDGGFSDDDLSDSDFLKEGFGDVMMNNAIFEYYKRHKISSLKRRLGSSVLADRLFSKSKNSRTRAGDMLILNSFASIIMLLLSHRVLSRQELLSSQVLEVF
ncbi:hypothetical protein ACP4OV_009504 [Aristida adscensionis]